MQTGSRNPPKPELVMTGQREDISTWSQRLRHSFRTCPIHFHRYRHRPTMENTIRYKPEAEYPKPEVLITKQQKPISTQSQWLLLCFRASFSMMYISTSSDASLTRKFLSFRTYTGSSYNFATENDIKVISAAVVMFQGTPDPPPPASTSSN